MNNKVDYVKQSFKKGTKIEIIEMQDEYNPVPTGTIGYVDFVDSEGQIHMNWNNGSTLALIVGIDKFKILDLKEKDINL